jgi:acetyl esterase
MPDGNGPFPILVYFHGGGYVIGNLDTHDSPCRALTNRASCLVVSADYRLAPEHKFPAAIEDAYATTQWFAKNANRLNGDANRIAVGGDSAGGNLAAAVCLMARDKGGPELRYQILIYPITNLASFDTDSYRDHAEGYMLTGEGMVYYRDHYINRKEDLKNPYVSPLLADDLSGLPPALMIAAEYDVLKDEGKAYVDRLQQSGVPVDYRLCDDMIHAFFNMAGVVDRTQDAYNDIATGLQSAFGI